MLCETITTKTHIKFNQVEHILLRFFRRNVKYQHRKCQND